MNETTMKLQEDLVHALLDKRALNVLSMDVSEMTPVSDCFIIASGNSDVHMRALMNAVTKCLDDHDQDYKIEGAMSTQWILIDAGTFVVHIFSIKAREFYKIERVWEEAPTQHYEDEE